VTNLSLTAVGPPAGPGVYGRRPGRRGWGAGPSGIPVAAGRGGVSIRWRLSLSTG